LGDCPQHAVVLPGSSAPCPSMDESDSSIAAHAGAARAANAQLILISSSPASSAPPFPASAPTRAPAELSTAVEATALSKGGFGHCMLSPCADRRRAVNECPSLEFIRVEFLLPAQSPSYSSAGSASVSVRGSGSFARSSRPAAS
jgi:hypothetical protein